jgi:hypothetical protein
MTAAESAEELENAAGFTETENKTGLRSIRDIIKDLSKPVAKRHLRSRKQGGKDIKFISWHDAIKYLDHYAPGWNYEVRNIQNIAGKLILTVRLSIPCAEGIVFREATGQEDEDRENYGDSSSNAESMALRRASAKFGLGLYLYDQ